MPHASILIVDDDADNALLLQVSLEGAGFDEVRAITDPTRVLGACAELEPDLILLDLRMPVMDGFDVLEVLRSTDHVCSNVPVLVLTADVSTEARNKALSMGANDFLSKPYDSTEIALRSQNLLETRRLQLELERRNESLEMLVRERTRELWQAVQRVERTEQEVRRSRREAVIRLATAAEFRDDESVRHVERMSRYCKLLAQRSGHDEESSKLILLASMLHDVGKIGIPDSIIMMGGKLTHEQRLSMQKHAQIGFDILSGSGTPLLDLAASIAMTHHERFDGSGYPRGISGAVIPLEGRIAAIADVFDALTTDRAYRRRYDLTTALSMMKAGRGTKFDPGLLDDFFDSIDEVLMIKEQHEDVPEGGTG